MWKTFEWLTGNFWLTAHFGKRSDKMKEPKMKFDTVDLTLSKFYYLPNFSILFLNYFTVEFKHESFLEFLLSNSTMT